MLDEMSPTRLAWLAGFVDGEGTMGVSVRPSTATSRSLRLSLNSYCYFSISQSEPRHSVLFELADETGLGVVKCKRIARLNPNYKEAWYWYVRGPKVIPLLEKLMPYLRCKRRHAELMLEMQATKLNAHIGARRGGSSGDLRVDDGIILRRINIVKELCILNKRGCDEKKNLKLLNLIERHYEARIGLRNAAGDGEPKAGFRNEKAALGVDTDNRSDTRSGSVWLGG